MTKIKELVTLLQELAPLNYQEIYDNSGLQTGDLQDDITGVWLVQKKDGKLEVLEEAIAAKCNVIVAHHPVIFKPLKKLTGGNEVEQVIIKAIRHKIAIYACHTNLDNVLPGVNGKICEKLGLESIKILSPKENTLCKLVTFAPIADTQIVLDALHAAGAGQIGDYKNCSFRVTGTGSFLPTAGANPHIGEINKQEQVTEDRLEVIFPGYLKNKILAALFAAHPYEEVAYDIYQLQNANQEIGAGMVGYLPKAMPPDYFFEYLKTKMALQHVRRTALLPKPIKKVAVCGGAGIFLLNDAIRQEADIFITADLKYKDFFAAEGRIIIADIGHYESEVYTKEIFYDTIIKKFTNFAVLKSKVNTNPVSYN